MKKRITALAMSLLMLFSCCILCGCEQSSSPEEEKTAFPIIYIPLDNRPINDLQVRLLAKSLSMDIIMPDEGIYATALNGAANDSGLQYGDRAALLEWLMAHEQDSDIIVLYLDQLLSGGLMNSRCMEEMEAVTLSDGRSFTEYEIIDYLAKLAETHTLYIIDSQLRLATSSDYLDFRLDDYSISRAYGRVQRPELGEDASIDDVIENYTLSADGRDAAEAAELTEEQLEYFCGDGEKSPLERYLSIRERKFRLNAYALERLYSLENVRYFFGVDDSASGNNIQSAEYDYLNRLAGGNLEKLSAIDCLGELTVSCVFNDYCENEPVSVSVKYYGDKNGELNYAGHTISEAVEQILRVCGGELTDGTPDVEILVSCCGENDGNTEEANKSLIKQLNENFEKRQPTVYVDFGAVVNHELPAQTDITMLLSAGLHANGSGASAIMGISQGLARYRTLNKEGYLTDSCHEAFLEELVFMFAKGYYWNSASKQEMSNYLQGLGVSESNMTSVGGFKLRKIEQELTDKIVGCSANILESTKDSRFISSLSPYTESAVQSVSIDNCTYPWRRTFEFSAELRANLG